MKKEGMPATLTAEMIDRFQRDFEHHSANNTLLDLPCPNGKKLRDCTFAEVPEMGRLFEEAGLRLKALAQFFSDENTKH
jgi:hypothetical protein